MHCDKQEAVKAARRAAERERQTLLAESTGPKRTPSSVKASTPRKPVVWVTSGSAAGKTESATSATRIELSCRVGHARPETPYRVIRSGYDWHLIAVCGRPCYVPKWAVRGVK